MHLQLSSEESANLSSVGDIHEALYLQLHMVQSHTHIIPLSTLSLCSSDAQTKEHP